jgi:hypothetical protein
VWQGVLVLVFKLWVVQQRQRKCELSNSTRTTLSVSSLARWAAPAREGAHDLKHTNAGGIIVALMYPHYTILALYQLEGIGTHSRALQCSSSGAR